MRDNREFDFLHGGLVCCTICDHSQPVKVQTKVKKLKRVFEKLMAIAFGSEKSKATVSLSLENSTT